MTLTDDLTLDLAGLASQRLTVTGVISDGGGGFELTVQGSYLPAETNVDVANFTQAISVGSFVVFGPSVQVGSLVTVPLVDVIRGVFGGTGTVLGDVSVDVFATLAPGGLGASGTLVITGTLALDGTLLVEVGDLVDVTGTVSLGGDSRYRPDLGGVSPIAALDILTCSTLLGTFNGIGDLDTVLFGSDAFTLDYTANSVSLNPGALPALPGKVFTGVNDEGTPFTVRLTGPGQLAIFVDGEHASVITRNTTAASVLTITSKPTAGSSGIVTFSNILVNGVIKSISAPSSIILDTVGVTGTVTSITIAGIDGDQFLATSAIQVGGTGATNVKAALLSVASVVTAGTLKTLTLTGGAPILLPAGIFPVGSFFAGTISAAAVGTIKLTWDLVADLNVVGAVGSIQAGGLLSSAFTGSDVGGRVNQIRAGAIVNFSLEAQSLSSLTVVGHPLTKLAANVRNSEFVLLGAAPGAGAFGLRTVNIKGNVEDSRFIVAAGNVNSFTAARFLSSDLFVGYQPDGLFNEGGTFTGAFRINTFRTTAAQFTDLAGHTTFSFESSQVAADRLVTVRVASLNTVDEAGLAFGFKFDTAGGSVRVTKTASNVLIPINTNLTPALNSLADDFFYLDA